MKKDTKEKYMYSLGALVVIGFFAIIGIMLFLGTFKDSLNILVGTLSAAFGSIIGYFFGSSKSSAEKTELMSKNGKTVEVEK